MKGCLSFQLLPEKLCCPCITDSLSSPRNSFYCLGCASRGRSGEKRRQTHGSPNLGAHLSPTHFCRQQIPSTGWDVFDRGDPRGGRKTEGFLPLPHCESPKLGAHLSPTYFSRHYSPFHCLRCFVCGILRWWWWGAKQRMKGVLSLFSITGHQNWAPIRRPLTLLAIKSRSLFGTFLGGSFFLGGGTNKI